MGVKKFIANVVKSLNLENHEASGKKKSIKHLIEKLELREIKLTEDIEKESDSEKLIQLQEELDIISLYIEKATKKLDKLNSKK
ncbi:hypothetical protein SMGD1_1672 [Sulfurimonas gotlandica GD1]|jgi:hypothetical protein|uniref:Uncharacterized protein n=1 Tax=Sulfurimonas gotlandica (strain DSM 19862 / JCM 16533 / GD1) TaxID=929558 RepID=B6BI43_SULGG|nr:hypothetical protein [Sulfurimonas gotlandica]EDZ63360.1 hypothetical protein CBGD1_980 [Sulfurimonas gotlandica GD1]EHP30196.1 hypothetical protein SMGD1_1672 [Sulfurimonas gotlandica GD1]